MAVDLPVAVGMKKYAMVRPITAAMGSPHHRDPLELSTDEALPTAPQIGFHLHTKSVLEVFLPVQVVRVGICFQLGIGSRSTRMVP
jgi:hypothetical protein